MLRTGNFTSIGESVSSAAVNLSKDFVIERLLQAVILRLHPAPARLAKARGVVENRRKVETARFPVIFPEIDGRFHVKHVDAANHFVYGAESQAPPCTAEAVRQ